MEAQGEQAQETNTITTTMQDHKGECDVQEMTLQEPQSQKDECVGNETAIIIDEEKLPPVKHECTTAVTEPDDRKLPINSQPNGTHFASTMVKNTPHGLYGSSFLGPPPTSTFVPLTYTQQQRIIMQQMHAFSGFENTCPFPMMQNNDQQAIEGTRWGLLMEALTLPKQKRKSENRRKLTTAQKGFPCNVNGCTKVSLHIHTSKVLCSSYLSCTSQNKDMKLHTLTHTHTHLSLLH